MQFDHLDEVLQHATDAREVAGVVAIATTDTETIYEGAFGRRDITSMEPMTVRHRVLDRVDDKGDHGDRRHAAR